MVVHTRFPKRRQIVGINLALNGLLSIFLDAVEKVVEPTLYGNFRGGLTLSGRAKCEFRRKTSRIDGGSLGHKVNSRRYVVRVVSGFITAQRV